MLITACSTLPRPSSNSDFEKEFGVQEVAPDTFVITDKFFYEWSPSKIIAVNTHFHPDGTGGNEAFKRAGAEIWSSDLTRKLLNENPSSAQAEAFASRPELKERILQRKKVLAERIFPLEKGKEFDLGGEEVKVMLVGGGHSRDNTPAIQKLQTLEAQVVVPGHGKLGGPELLDHTLKLAQKEAHR
jgi:glyoxylase-like metal-dependent hydrolase (beta-lactamase superfamily II)